MGTLNSTNYIVKQDGAQTKLCVAQEERNLKGEHSLSGSEGINNAVMGWVTTWKGNIVQKRNMKEGSVITEVWLPQKETIIHIIVTGVVNRRIRKEEKRLYHLYRVQEATR